MNHAKSIVWSVMACVFALAPAVAVGASFTFDDIEYWVGIGANRAALVIDWVDNSTNPPALLWGYRWDGPAHGSDMLAAVVAADDRLFAKFAGTKANPSSAFGLGYDANDDGQFALDDDTSFDEQGIAITAPADGGASLDGADYYAEGWFTGFWHYGFSDANPYDGGSWTSSQIGMNSRPLVDGSWDSWTFSPTFSFTAFATNPQPAPSPYPPGDFDQDGNVTAADYDIWKNSFGSNSNLAADANRNGIVDAADYTIWRDHVSAESTFRAPSFPVPEPSSFAVIVAALLPAIGLTVRAWRLAP